LSETRAGTDLPTVLSIAVVAYCLTNVIHEGLGHGGACLVAGGKPLELNAIFFRSEDAAMTAAGRRLLAAGGSIANLVFAIAAWVALRLHHRPGPLHYFFALMLALNLLMPFGYLLFSGLGGFGDWAVFIEDLGPPLLLRAVLAASGAFLYFVVAPRIVMPALNPYLGREPTGRAARARVFSLYPYLIGGSVYIIAGLFNPFGWKVVVLSAAAASFGGASLLAWYPGGADAAWRAAAPEEPADVPRSLPWIMGAAVAAAIFVGVLGPGLRL
jgi:hypothetical protein